MTWKQLTERDPREWKLSAIGPHDRDTWRSGVRPAMRAASQLPGRDPLLWTWTSSFSREKAPLVWTRGTLQQCSQDSLYIQVYGKRGPGRPKMTWKQLTVKDRSE